MIEDLSRWDWAFVGIVVVTIHVLFWTLAGRGGSRKPRSHDSTGQG